MKWAIIAALALFAVTVHGSPLTNAFKEKDMRNVSAVENSVNNGTLVEDQTKTETAVESKSNRFKRSCEMSDLNKLQGQVIASLERQIEKLLSRKKRDSLSFAGATAEADSSGNTKSSAVGTSSKDLEKNETKGAASTSLVVSILHGNETSPPAVTENLTITPPPSTPATEQPFRAPVSENTIQDLKAVASKDNGTAIVKAVVQKLRAEGNKTIPTGEAPDQNETNIQRVDAVDNKSITASHINASAETPARSAREICTPVKMTNNLRLLIHSTVEQAFDEIKKDLFSHK